MLQWIDEKLDSKIKRIIFIIWTIALLITIIISFFTIYIASNIKNDGKIWIEYDNCIKLNIASQFNTKLMKEKYSPYLSFEDTSYNKIFEKIKFKNNYFDILFNQNDQAIAYCVFKRAEQSHHLNLVMLTPEIAKLYIFLIGGFVLIFFGPAIWSTTFGRLLLWIKNGRNVG